MVLVGNMTIQLNPHTQLQVEAGDLVLIPSGQNHSCHSNNKNNLVEALNITELFDQKRQETIEFGSSSGEPALILAIRCHIDTIMARPLLNALPNYIHIHHITGSTAPEWLQIGLHFLAVEAYQIRPGRDKNSRSSGEYFIY